MANEKSWRAVAIIADLENKDAIQVIVEGIPIAIFKVLNKYFATSNICTHAHAQLCDGYVEGEEVECPLHSGRFHIPTGKALGPPVTENLKTYPVQIEGNNILIGF